MYAVTPNGTPQGMIDVKGKTVRRSVLLNGSPQNRTILVDLALNNQRAGLWRRRPVQTPSASMQLIISRRSLHAFPKFQALQQCAA